MNRNSLAGLAGILAGALLLSAPAEAQPNRTGKRHSSPQANQAQIYSDSRSNDLRGWSQRGTASYYGYGRLSRYTASGAVFDRSAMTAAHPWLPFGTRVRVRDEKTGREVTVTITDRLPSRHRVIDLSVGAARELGILRRGLTTVSIERTT